MSSPLNALQLETTGKVADADEWVRLSSQSLEQCCQESLMERINVTSINEIHQHDRFAVLSHTLDEIFCYFNRAALETFEQSEPDVYQLHSKYSAPDFVREKRAQVVQQAVVDDLQVFSTAVRITAQSQRIFVLQNVLLWNVYDESGERLGQTALYDRESILPYEDES